MATEFTRQEDEETGLNQQEDAEAASSKHVRSQTTQEPIPIKHTFVHFGRGEGGFDACGPEISWGGGSEVKGFRVWGVGLGFRVRGLGFRV